METTSFSGDLNIMQNKYINPTDAAAVALFSKNIVGEIVMLNMIKFNKTANYIESPQLAPDQEITGQQAYQLYMQHTAPFLAASGGEVIFMGEASNYFIGPQDSQWDLVFLVRQKSLKHFMDFASNQEYLAGIGHRTAAVEDSRLLPITPINNKNKRENA